MDSLVKHGTMVTAADISKADVAIKDGRVAMIGANLEEAGARHLHLVDLDGARDEAHA